MATNIESAENCLNVARINGISFGRYKSLFEGLLPDYRCCLREKKGKQ